MVTYDVLFAYSLVIIGLVGLVITRFANEMTAPRQRKTVISFDFILLG